MRNVIKIVAILALLGSRGAIAQTVGTARSPAGSPTTVTAPFSLTQDTRLIDGAPVGHRQPHVRDVPTQNPGDRTPHGGGCRSRSQAHHLPRLLKR